MNAMRERFGALVDEGAVERIGERDFVAIVALESGARAGLVDEGRWALTAGEGLVVFEPGSERMFVEVLEQPRPVFDEQIERGAAERGFPVEELLFSFPAIELVRAMLASRSPHFARAALLWLLPSELRELRADIARAADDTRLTDPVRELARRLVVPER